MGDEIKDANVIHIWQELDDQGLPFNPAQWVASIGPHDQGKQAPGINPIEALSGLMMACHNDRWPFDLGWRPDHVKARSAPHERPATPPDVATTAKGEHVLTASNPGPMPGPIPPKATS